MNLAFILTGIPDRLATTTFHRPQIYLLSYYIDFRQLRFGLQMKVNAGGCTHRDKLDVVSKYNFLPSLHINSCMHMRACIARGLSGTPVHVDITVLPQTYRYIATVNRSWGGMGAIFFCRVANFNALGIIEDSCLEVHAA